ncbi:MAG: tetratricopeptide repeat protein, partial [Nitrospinota bacterium]|nr:tetratricopeptide repeat protein [Nitrospinota bacterium]
MMNKSLLKKLGLVVVVVALFLSASQSAEGGFQEGLDAARRGDYATALKEFRPLAEQGHAVAQYNLGVMYREGLGVPKDNKLAVKWFRKSAEQGDAYAQYNLGFMYEKGLGVPKDFKLAVKWYRKSAEQG